jgi:hypothetical protein
MLEEFQGVETEAIMAGKSSSGGRIPAKKAASQRVRSPKAAREHVFPMDVLAEWVQGILPQASVVRKPSGAMFQAGTKIFAFTRPEGVALKLPETRIAQLVEIRDASFLVMGTKTMREWVLLRYNSPDEFKKDEKLFGEAMTFVASPRAKRKS